MAATREAVGHSESVFVGVNLLRDAEAEGRNIAAGRNSRGVVGCSIRYRLVRWGLWQQELPQQHNYAKQARCCLQHGGIIYEHLLTFGDSNYNNLRCYRKYLK